ncbi:hypothetical protein GW17_00006310 [Ensete ventricosum]|nr:hypothetical protein GW17_00006310 [Ensete ventricosum]RZS02557.1 hypothetical protein BHM03_00032621 [Ensete ventricosum]
MPPVNNDALLRFLPASVLLLLVLLLTTYVDFSSLSSPFRFSSSSFATAARPIADPGPAPAPAPAPAPTPDHRPETFTDLAAAFARWDEEVGCDRFREKHSYGNRTGDPSAIQDAEAGDCSSLGARHVSILVKGWSWIPDEMDDLYSCRCGMSCLWTKSEALVDKPDAVFFEWDSPPKTFRNELAEKFFAHISHHSFGGCMNNVGGSDAALSFYPECKMELVSEQRWWGHVHCAMSHYKFVLAIENTKTDSYITEKLYYALDAGAVPIYFGAPDVESFVPPHSIIDGSKFDTMEELASYVKAVADDPIAYAEYHAWRRCGLMGSYRKNRATSLDALPCRLCESVSRKGGRDAA